MNWQVTNRSGGNNGLSLFSITLRNQCLLPPLASLSNCDSTLKENKKMRTAQDYKHDSDENDDDDNSDNMGSRDSLTPGTTIASKGWHNQKYKGPWLQKSTLEIYSYEEDGTFGDEIDSPQDREEISGSQDIAIIHGSYGNSSDAVLTPPQQQAMPRKRLWYQSTCSNASVNPQWNDLYRLADALDQEQQKQNASTACSLENLRARIVLDLSSNQSASGNRNDGTPELNFQVNLHPAITRVILADESLDPVHWSCHGTAGEHRSASSPSALPPNTLILQYGDGSLCMPSSAFDYLTECQILQTIEASNSDSSDDNNNHNDAKRNDLSDKASLHQIDGKTPTEPLARTRALGPMSTTKKQDAIFSDKAFDALVGPSTPSANRANKEAHFPNILGPRTQTAPSRNTPLCPSDLLLPPPNDAAHSQSTARKKKSHNNMDDLYSLLGGDSSESEENEGQIVTAAAAADGSMDLSDRGIEVVSPDLGGDQVVMSEPEADTTQNTCTNIDMAGIKSPGASSSNPSEEPPTPALTNEKSPEEVDPKDASSCLTPCEISALQNLPTSSNDYHSNKLLSALERELCHLEALLQQESQLLKQQSASCHRAVDKLHEIIEETQLVEEEVSHVTHNVLPSQETALAHEELRLSTRQCKLLKDLRAIYPITSASNNSAATTPAGVPSSSPHRTQSSSSSTASSTYSSSAAGASYRIRGLLIPSQDMLWNTHVLDHDTLSSALGYACHLVVMVAKYLDAPLRYRLICNASRSAVVEVTSNVHGSVLGSTYVAAPSSASTAVSVGVPLHGGNPSGTGSTTLTSSSAASQTGGGPATANGNVGGAIASSNGNVSSLLYPLFREKMEREHFERGVYLLGRNMDGILLKRGIPFMPRSHMLAKLDKLMEQTICGTR
jgi:hypothetical protein